MSDLIIRALVCLAFGACAAAIDWYVCRHSWDEYR